MARIQKILFFLFLFFFLLFHGIEATRGKAMLPTLPQKGAAFFFPKMMQSALCHPALIFYITRLAGPEERLSPSVESSVVGLVILVLSSV
ncbi:hypothetical protein HU200_013116 [Digitaria exilis]|uniref:Uncharacterized protein n=1 Tax=Digitaria exilis TaxID=1010633 RepID=A0A835FCY6_9POAL|nr:hypothetical protein HU200_013969 [Digitaria exilis]KAF8747980.1 hypothetical protein HU200_013116 [Digitaria exilis]